MFIMYIYHYVLFAVAGLSTVDHFDVEMQAKICAWQLPRIRVVPSEHLAITYTQVGEFCWPH